MRLLSLKKLLPFALMMLFGTGAWAQGVSVGKTANPAPPTATFHVWGDAKIDEVQDGGVEFLTRVPNGADPNATQIRKLVIPSDAKPGWGWIWDGTKWIMGPTGGGITSADPNIFIINGQNLELKPGTRAGDIIVWDGTKWVIQQGNFGGNYIGEEPIVIKDGGAGPDMIALNSTGAKVGDTWVWDGTKWTLQNVNAGWGLLGNTVDATHFIGTLNNFPFIVKTNATERMRITPTGSVAVNSDNPSPTDQFSSYSSTDGGVAVAGYAESGTGITFGVLGETYSSTANAAGLYGAAGSQTGSVYGVWGQTDSETGNTSGIIGVASKESTIAATFGVRGQTFSNQGGSAGVEGVAIGGRTSGVRGVNLSSETFSSGVTGTSTGSGTKGGMYFGVFGLANKSCDAVGVGVYGEGSIYGLFGRAKATPDACSFGYGVFSDGASGAVGPKTFHIDHPLDPENKFLNHISIESPEALNVYSGNITTGSNGEAIVKMPDYFSAINKDCRYNLTPVGQFANVIVLKKMEGNQFVIKSDKPNVEISWMVTAIRNDLYMQKYPLAAEQPKTGAEKGKYLRPELYNQPQEKGIFYNPLSSEEQKTEIVKPQSTAKERKAKAKINIDKR